MKKRIWIPICVLLMTSCQQKEIQEKKVPEENSVEKVDKKEDVFTNLTEQGIKEKIIKFLSRKEDHILSDSSFKFYKGQMNRDQVEDWVVTVNELQFAKKQLEKIGNLGAIDYGYLGNYNHIFVIDGATGKWNGRPIGSSALAPLEIEIDYVNSDQYQVAKIFYRVGTAKFIGIYNSSIPSFQEIFKWELYNLSDNTANGQPTGRIIEFKGDEGSPKSIEIFEAKVINFDDKAFVDNMYEYEPQLQKTAKRPIHVFEYQLAEGKFGENNK
ncbi:MAG: hypothetical protein R2799_15475 [Crocinitomicaceae bacterium]